MSSRACACLMIALLAVSTGCPGKPPCAAGFELTSPGTCADVNECTPARSASLCPGANAACVNLDPTDAANPEHKRYRCDCQSGFTLQGGVCVDADECTAPTTCGEDLGAGECTNLPNGGGYDCTCAAGYHETDPSTQPGVARTCVDNRECDSPTTCGEDVSAGTCTELTGSYSCQCHSGYERPSSSAFDTCADINDCSTNNGGCNATHGKCTNNVGAPRTCGCDPGYSGDGIASCTNIDECTINTDNCDPNATCTDTPGSFTCTCNPGFTGTGTTCTNVVECLDGNPCNEDNGAATCMDTLGSYVCTCLGGYHKTTPGVPTAACVDTDECSVNNGGCAVGATCTNTTGAFTCSCPGMQAPCAGVCLDVQSDEFNCGTCTTTCGGAEICVAGACAQARVNDVHPAVAAAGQKLRIEGVFPSSVTAVQFPGVAGTTVATRVGDGRLEVVVPAGATAGSLTLPSSANGPRFRRVSYGLGLGQFRSAYEQTSYARNWPILASARASTAVWSSRDWLYAVGGTDGAGTSLATTERALINADGTLASFVAGPSLTKPRGGAAVVRVFGRAYVIGGSGDASIDVATVQADGSLGNFADANVSLASNRSEHAAFVIGNAVYVVGGNSNTVERAPISSTGVLGNFVVVPGVNTAVVRRRAAVAVVGRFVFVFGGTSDGTTALASIERAPIDASGNVGAFVAAGSLRFPRDGAQAVHVGNTNDTTQIVVVMGGRTTSDTADRIAIDANSGAVSVSDSGVALKVGRRELSAAVVGNFVYALGGIDASGAVRTMERATIDVSGALGTGSVNSAITLGSRARMVYHHAVAAGRYVYLVGMSGGDAGFAAQTLLRASVADDGSVGAFSDVGSPVLPAAPAAVLDSRLLVQGGNQGSNCNADTQTRYIALDSAGAQTGSPADFTASMARAYGTLFALGTTAYFAGGFTSGCGVSTSVFASSTTYPVSWSTAGTSTSSKADNVLTSLVVDNTVHLFARTDRSMQSASVSGASLGAFTEATTALASSHVGLTVVVVGDNAYVLGDQNSTACEVASLPLAVGTGANGAFQPTAAPCMSSQRADASAMTIDNFVYVFGGRDSGSVGAAGAEVIPLQ